MGAWGNKLQKNKHLDPRKKVLKKKKEHLKRKGKGEGRKKACLKTTVAPPGPQSGWEKFLGGEGERGGVFCGVGDRRKKNCPTT